MSAAYVISVRSTALGRLFLVAALGVLAVLANAAHARAACTAPAKAAHVFYVTDREPATDAQLFSGERALSATRDAVITYGILGAAAERAGDQRCASEKAFMAALKSDFGATGARRVFIYIHGYYTPFRRAARDALALQHTLRFSGPAIVYSWPSKVTSRLGYVNDEDNAGWSTVHFRELLSGLLDAYPGLRISFAAHSLGARFAAEGIDFLRHGGCKNCVGPAVFFAPDIDSDTLRTILAGADLCRGKPAQAPAHSAPATLYVSNKDLALRQSQRLHGHQRAGQAGTEIVLCGGVDTIDVGYFKSSDSVGHSYHVDARVINDVRAAFAGISPAATSRKLTKVARDGRAYYELR